MKALRIIKLVIQLLLSLISNIIIIDWFTFYPVIYLFKGIIYLNELSKPFGPMGPYGDTTKYVSVSPAFAIDVKGNPSAYLTFFTPMDVKSKSLPTILYIHGGSWCAGTTKGVEKYCKLLASRGYLVASLDYSMAPVYKMPVSTIQAVEALNFLYENADKIGADRDHIFVAGNSAGAALASQAFGIVYNEIYSSLFDVDVRIPKKSLVGALLFDGVYNLADVRGSHFPLLRYYVWCYTGKRKYWMDEDIVNSSGINGINEEYPEIFLTVGDMDPLHGQTVEYIFRLMSCEVDYSALLWHDDKAGLGHDYFLNLYTEEAVVAFEAACQYLEKHSK